MRWEQKYAELELERFVSKALINYMVQTTLLFLTVLKREHSWLQQRITGGDILIENAVPEHLRSITAKMEEMGVKIIEENEGVRVIGPDKLKAVDIKTMPHPGFPTDMQSQMMALLLQADGTSMITETVFENRFMHVEEFRRMNADIKIEGRSVIMNGPNSLQGAEVATTDLRLCKICINLSWFSIRRLYSCN